MVNMSEHWIFCEYCGKKLIKRKSNGVFVLKFGRSRDEYSVIDLEIHGSIKLRCFGKTCRKLNVINYFPA